MSDPKTKNELIKEIVRCGKDPVYFLKTYAKIEHPQKGVIPFDLFDYQEDIIEKLIDERFNIILKARQLGMTTIIGGFMAWLSIFHKHQNIIIIATKQEKSKIPLRVVKNIYKYLPKWLMPGLVKVDVNNRTSVELSNGSRINALATSADVGVGEAVSFMLVDECALIDRMDELWARIWPTLSTGGRGVLSSTPNGAGNFFHRQWKNARDGVGSFNCRFGTYSNPEDPTETFDDRFMWWVKPGCNQEWFEMETANDSPRMVAQERMCNFNASGDTFVDSETIKKMEVRAKEPIRKEYVDKNLWIWKDPHPQGQYLISADISRGDAKDFSGFHVVRIDKKLEQVAEYKGKVKPDVLGVLLADIGRRYNNAFVAPENNSGWSGPTIMKMQEAGYKNIYYTKKRNKTSTGDYYYVDPYYAESSDNYQPGYTITPSNRLPMLGKLELYLRHNYIITYSERLVDELKTFIVTESGRPEARRGDNDDLVMGLAGLVWVREESFGAYGRDDGSSEEILAAISLESNTTKNYKDFNFDSNIYDRGRVVEHMEEQNKITLGNGDVLDIGWLIGKG